MIERMKFQTWALAQWGDRSDNPGATDQEKICSILFDLDTQLRKAHSGRRQILLDEAGFHDRYELDAAIEHTKACLRAERAEPKE